MGIYDLAEGSAVGLFFLDERGFEQRKKLAGGVIGSLFHISYSPHISQSSNSRFAIFWDGIPGNTDSSVAAVPRRLFVPAPSQLRAFLASRSFLAAIIAASSSALSGWISSPLPNIARRARLHHAFSA